MRTVAVSEKCHFIWELSPGGSKRFRLTSGRELLPGSSWVLFSSQSFWSKENLLASFKRYWLKELWGIGPKLWRWKDDIFSVRSSSSHIEPLAMNESVDTRQGRSEARILATLPHPPNPCIKWTGIIIVISSSMWPSYSLFAVLDATYWLTSSAEYNSRLYL